MRVQVYQILLLHDRPERRKGLATNDVGLLDLAVNTASEEVEVLLTVRQERWC